jgi:HAE1 family hydrophobic/amphiphilic exporter-1
MTVLLSISIVIAGTVAYFNIPVAALPSFNTPIISVSASLPGAAPENMASSVALPLEKEFSTIDGIKVISSTNTTVLPASHWSLRAIEILIKRQ